MPCDTRLSRGQTPAQRKQQIEDAIKRLENALRDKGASVVIGPQGAISFVGWQNREGVTDACAYRKLTAKGSWELKQAVAKAEAMSGKKVNEKAIASGFHSHDDGKTWGKD